MRNEAGFSNLASLLTRSRVGSLYEWRREDVRHTRGRPRLTWEQVAARGEGLYALTGPFTGEIPSLVRSQRYDEALYALSRWRDVFGEQISVEVQQHHTGGEESALAELIELSNRAGVPWVATQDAATWTTTHGSRMTSSLRCGTTAPSTKRSRAGCCIRTGEWRLRSPREVASRWRGREEGLAENRRIAAECDFSLRWMRPPLPRFPECPGLDDDDSW